MIRRKMLFAAGVILLLTWIFGFYTGRHYCPLRLTPTKRSEVKPIVQEKRLEAIPLPEPTTYTYTVDGLDDTFSRTVQDLYGDGTPNAYLGALAGVKGLLYPDNPDYIQLGQTITFPQSITTLDGRVLTANMARAHLRWEARQARQAEQATANSATWIRLGNETENAGVDLVAPSQQLPLLRRIPADLEIVGMKPTAEKAASLQQMAVLPPTISMALKWNPKSMREKRQ